MRSLDTVTGHDYPWPPRFHRRCCQHWSTREPDLCDARILCQAKGVCCLWSWLVFEYANGKISSGQNSTYSHQCSGHLSGTLILVCMWDNFFSRGCLSTRQPAKAPPWEHMTRGNTSPECCQRNQGLQIVSLIFLDYFWSFFLRIGSLHVCSLVLDCIVHGRPLTSGKLHDDDNRSFLYRVLEAIATDGKTILRVFILQLFYSINIWFRLQVNERSCSSAIESGARWTEKREKWGYGRWYEQKFTIKFASLDVIFFDLKN